MKKKRFSISKTVVLLLIAVLVTIGVTSIIHTRYTTLNYKEYDMLMKVTADESGIGIGIIPGMMYFGKMSEGNSGMQKIVLRHNYHDPVLVQVVASGRLKGWVAVSENNFILEGGVTKTVNVTATVPEGASLGNHTGKLKVYLKRI